MSQRYPMNTTGLLVGLGNPGKEYEQTRHNFGFLALDALLRTLESNETVNVVSGKKDAYALSRCTLRAFGKGTWFMAKPLSFMNRSGLVVQHIAHYYQIEPRNILVLHDELDLPLGRMKMKSGGGNAGHNGLKSIQQMLGTPDFYRLRLGIGKPAGFDTSSYVLGKFSPAEQALVDETIPAIIEALRLFMMGERITAQQYCNGFRPPSPGPLPTPGA